MSNFCPSREFTDFTELYSTTIDEACKLEIPKVTKRTHNNNPWITESLIDAINKKHALKKQWSKTTSKKNPKGNSELYHTFSNYRKTLQRIIRRAQKSYYCNEISENIENKKKVWQIINTVQGKVKRDIRACFVIDNKKSHRQAKNSK